MKNNNSSFIKIFIITLMTFLFSFVFLEYYFGKYYINKLSDEIESKRKIEFVDSWNNFFNQKKTEYLTMVKGYAWWNEIAEAFRTKDYKYVLENAYVGDYSLKNDYDVFLAVADSMKFIYGVIDKTTSVENFKMVNSKRNLEIDKDFFRLTEGKFYEAIGNYDNYVDHYKTIKKDISKPIVWNFIEKYAGEIQILTLSPICMNWGYPNTKGFLLFGNKMNKIAKQAEKIIPAKITITDKKPTDVYVHIEIESFLKQNFYITIEPNIIIKDIASKTLYFFLIVQTLFIALLFSFIYPYSTRKYTIKLKTIISEKTSEITEKNEVLKNTNNKLTKALDEVKQLSGFLPICSSCKSIRNDDGYWNHVESFIAEHTDAEFSHSLCPDCLHKLYPEVADKVEDRLNKK